MSFLDDLRPASLRGIPFLTETDTASGGRRYEVHQYPGRDEPFQEDMGLDVKDFTITAIIQGSGFVTKALAFEKALDLPGPAQLMHPHYGLIQVAVMKWSRSHSNLAVGEVIFSLTLQKWGTANFPVAASNTAAGLLSSSEAAFAAISGDFESFFTASGIPDFITGDSVARNLSFMTGLNQILSKGGILNAVTSAFPVLDVLKSGFADQAVTLFKTIRELAAPVKKPVIGKVSSKVSADPVALVRSMIAASDKRLITEDEEAITNKGIRLVNAQSLDFMHRMSSLTAGVGAARFAQYESREQAVALREQLGSRLSTLRGQLGEAGWDDSWQQAAALQAALNRDINSQLGRLPKTVSVQPVGLRSSLAVAHRLYGAEALISKADDIVARNAIRHPGFVPVKPLEVLIASK